MIKKRGGLQQKIILAMLVVGFLPGAVGIYFTYLSGTEALKESTGANFQAIAKKTAEKIDSILNQEVHDVRSLAISPSIRSFVKEVNARERIPALLKREVTDYLVKYQQQRGKDILSIRVTDKRGGIIAATPAAPAIPSHQSSEFRRQNISGDGKERVFIGEIDLMNRSTQVYSILIAVPVIDEKTGMMIGGVETIYNTENIFGSILDIGIGKTGHANLVSSDGTVLICPLFPAQTHNINDNLLRQIATAQPGWETALDDAHGGRNSIIGFAPVKTTLKMGNANFGGKQWYIFVRQLPEEAYAPFYTLLWRVSVLGFSMAGLLSFFGYYLARMIVSPIRILSEGARLIGEGQLDHRLDIKTGDEIEGLAEIFNQMSKDLYKRFEEVRIERDKLNRVMNSIADGLVILDQDFKILYMNANFLALYGMESIGKPCHEVLGIGDMSCEICFLRNREDSGPHTVEVNTGDGRTYIVTHSPIKNADGTLSSVVIFKDITRRKTLEQKLLLSERMAALSEFSSTFAHDLRNPIIGVKKAIEMLKDSPIPLQEEITKRVYADLISTCGLLLGLINDIIDIHQVSYKGLPLIFSSFSLSQALEEVINLLKIEAEERKVRVMITGGNKEIWIDGDKRRLQRVFINLLSNALKYSPPGGDVVLSFETSILSDESSTGVNLLFKIEDEGPGIAPGELSKIFDLFYKIEEGAKKSGTGLGLYFCKVVVEAHGGRIWAENRKNGGAVFHIEMPLVGRRDSVYQSSYSR